MAEIEKTVGTILGPDGAPAIVPTLVFTADEARAFREYRKILVKYGLKEALFCNDCWEGGLSDGCQSYVTSGQILVKCRCKLRFHQGYTA